MTMIKQAAIYYSASTVYELFHLESAMAFCFEAKLHPVLEEVLRSFIQVNCNTTI